jgi:1-acyl-sn-glycerol-3-phosphate acyltransferase
LRGPEITHQAPTSSLFGYWFWRLWMKLTGWTVSGDPPDCKKMLIIGAPHTSNWDILYMFAGTAIYRVKVSWMGKHSLFKPPLGGLLKALGGIAIDRRSPQGAVDQIAAEFEKANEMALVMASSGTRSRTEYWRSGFYWIANKAQIPIVCGFIDFARKTAGLGLSFVPTGDVVADMDRIREFYRGIAGKYPDNMSRIRLRIEDEIEERTRHEQGATLPPDPRS